MPELPEVETMVRGIRPHVAGKIIRTVSECRCPCKPISITPTVRTMQRRAREQTITSVDRLAKRVVLHLSSGDAFVIEPRMTGLMLLADPPSTEHLRICWTLSDGESESKLWFWDRRGLGTVRLYRPAEFDELRTVKLGPDALTIDREEWTQRLQKTNRAIKVAMLDQKIVAGIGNLYASEILHLSGISPFTLCSSLTETEIDRLHDAVRQILSDAIRYEGSTLSDGTYRNALNKAGGYQNEHRVYARAEELCPTCQETPIQRVVQAQRSTFYCPICQSSPPESA
ncbi:bifunctional DNA-formamidopyrimidine glycosylase/DNA-(apurinic or apyrimidinic site) lyase [Thalassoroseus pseudoceratinae]|uniref:bifunctional DNA-formamidopyrimidine glycosylase/DNA-(apurinic or apyrimidinic site) lyase n=1 Tax=Thalassoroseus pseudoceratinae TaxID=2713176 RepID=UPI00141F2656|nr:bifunctional DNA-formamidopyrimidine glycosylase/DNA-(apurinic or apyrimidinic site) lyase [Thalassoroseus pseudoceratinae]